MVSSCTICHQQWRFAGWLIYLVAWNLLFVWQIHGLILQFYQPYAAAKAREYLDKPAIHETMVKVFFFICSSCIMKNYMATTWYYFSLEPGIHSLVWYAYLYFGYIFRLHEIALIKLEPLFYLLFIYKNGQKSVWHLVTPPICTYTFSFLHSH